VPGQVLEQIRDSPWPHFFGLQRSMTCTSVLEAGAAGTRLPKVPFFGALDESTIDALETELEWLSVPGGWTLFREDDVADALYAVVTGCRSHPSRRDHWRNGACGR
jgi:hypothetical protein